MNKFYSLVFLILVLQQTFAIKAQDKCEALVLSGGSDYASYSAGAISALIEKGGVKWDVFSGISTSALTAVVLSQFEQEDKTTGQELEKFWENLRLNHMSKTFPGGVGYGLTYQPGMFSNEPLREYLQDNLQTQNIKQNFSIGVTDIDTGSLMRFTNEDLGEEEIIGALMAAMGLPAYFPWRNFKNKNYFDGGVATTIDLVGAVNSCMQLVDDESNIVLDVVAIFSESVAKEWGSQPKQKTFEAFRQSTLIKSYARFATEFTQFFDNHPKVQCRFFVEPTTVLPDAKQPFYFKADQIKDQVTKGNTDGAQAVLAGQGCQDALNKAMVYKFRESDPSSSILSDQEIIQLIRL